MADAKRLDPFRGYQFRVTVAGFAGQLAFKKVSGLSIAVNVKEYREGTDPATMRKLPGLAVFDNIVLERGVSDNIDLINWMQEIVSLSQEDQLPLDDEFRREVTIEVLSRRNEIVRQYLATASWPASLKLADLDAESDDVLIESLELAHEGLFIDTAAVDIAPQSA